MNEELNDLKNTVEELQLLIFKTYGILVHYGDRIEDLESLIKQEEK